MPRLLSLMSLAPKDMNRPFYSKFAWAYDHISEGHTASRTDFIEHVLSDRGIQKGSVILDAGCGTGSISIALAQRGFNVIGIDNSQELLSQAKSKAKVIDGNVSFTSGDILCLPSSRIVDAIICRGVLNDFVEDVQRGGVFTSFSKALYKGGTLIFDVREWCLTRLKKERNPIFEKNIMTEKGLLTFRSVTKLDYCERHLHITERHVLVHDGHEDSDEYEFIMRCWTKDEIKTCLDAANFQDIAYFGDYNRNVPIGKTDRIVAVATLR